MMHKQLGLRFWTRALALAVVLPTAVLADTRTYSPEDEALYLKRYAEISQIAGRGLEAYDPLEPVAGAPFASLPHARRPSIAPEALSIAQNYAAERRSSALIVWRGGKIEAEHYFGGHDATMPIVSKSLAKPVTALLIGRAIKLGYIKSLDQPVADFITEWKGDPQRSRIKIRHLLDMRGGLLMQAEGSGPQDILNRAYLHPHHDEIIIGEYPLINQPGTRYDYSNATAELIAPVIERATGKRYSQFLSEALLKPLGAAGGSVWVNRPGGMAHSGCCLMLPPQSWLRMAILVMQDGRWHGRELLPRGYAQAMRTPTAENPHYGMGIWVAGNYIERRGFAHPSIPYGKVLHSQPYADRNLYMFDGNSNQVVYIAPSRGLIVLRTGERPAATLEWDNAFLPNVLVRGAMRRPGDRAMEPQPR